jgi:hypothetical protein
LAERLTLTCQPAHTAPSLFRGAGFRRRAGRRRCRIEPKTHSSAAVARRAVDTAQSRASEPWRRWICMASRFTGHAESSASRRGRASRRGDLGLAAWSSRLGGPFEHPCPDRASGRVLRESVSPVSPATHMSVTQAVLRSAAGALAGASSVHLDAESLDDTDGLHDASADVQRKRAFSDAFVSRSARVVPDRRAGGRCYERRLRSPVRISLMRISGCSRAAKCPPLSASP